jgi:hypothetical protein
MSSTIFCSPVCSSGVLLGRNTGDHLQLSRVSSAMGREGNRIRDPQQRRYLTITMFFFITNQHQSFFQPAEQSGRHRGARFWSGAYYCDWQWPMGKRSTRHGMAHEMMLATFACLISRTFLVKK